MKLLRSATLSVADIGRSQGLYERYLEYRTVESGNVDRGLAESWGAPKAEGAAYAVLQPSSGANIFLRLVQQPPHPDFVPLQTYGWAAIEICVQDTHAVCARMADSPFTIIGPPKELDGLPAIFPMQVQGPNGEIVYLTQIRDDLPMYDLPRAQSLIDRLFILVIASSDMAGALAFARDRLGLSFGREISLAYTMLAKSFGKPLDTKYTICTVTHERDVFFEFDQYPPAATPRPQHPGLLAPGVAMGGLWLPDFDKQISVLSDFLITPPEARVGPIYGGKRAATVRGPDGTLFEVYEP
ncbi:MAG: VOC family protein [Caulobacterales bacterium]